MSAIPVGPTVGAAWALLAVAGALEVVWLVLLKRSEGLSRPVCAASSIALAWLSFWLLSIVVRTLPAGTSYAVWTGIGAAGGALAGMALFGESREFLRVGGIGLIVTGIVAVKIAK
jgi:quaternary ammonium compound-resistance protein SugE